MGTYDNFDELYEEEEEPTNETESLGETTREEELIVETYDPENPPDDGKPNNNRIFMIALGVLALVFIVSILAMIFFASRSLPAQQQEMTETAAAVIAINEQTIVAATLSAAEQAANTELTRIASEWTSTPLPTAVVVSKATEAPAEPTSTVIVVQPAAEDAETTPTVDPAVYAAQTATIEALLTQVAAEATATEIMATPNEAQLTATQNAAVLAADAESGGGTELPDTGILDDGNIYWMGGGALLMVAVIIITRKLRKS